MPEHDVSFPAPERLLTKADVVFSISEDGELLGTLEVSKGGLD